MTTPSSERGAAEEPALVVDMAASLTEAQKDKLLYGVFARVSLNGNKGEMPGLRALGLIEQSEDINGKPHWLFDRLTPLGLAILAHLKEQP